MAIALIPDTYPLIARVSEIETKYPGGMAEYREEWLAQADLPAITDELLVCFLAPRPKRNSLGKVRAALSRHAIETADQWLGELVAGCLVPKAGWLEYGVVEKDCACWLRGESRDHAIRYDMAAFERRVRQHQQVQEEQRLDRLVSVLIDKLARVHRLPLAWETLPDGAKGRRMASRCKGAGDLELRFDGDRAVIHWLGVSLATTPFEFGSGPQPLPDTLGLLAKILDDKLVFWRIPGSSLAGAHLPLHREALDHLPPEAEAYVWSRCLGQGMGVGVRSSGLTRGHWLPRLKYDDDTRYLESVRWALDWGGVTMDDPLSGIKHELLTSRLVLDLGFRLGIPSESFRPGSAGKNIVGDHVVWWRFASDDCGDYLAICHARQLETHASDRVCLDQCFVLSEQFRDADDASTVVSPLWTIESPPPARPSPLIPARRGGFVFSLRRSTENQDLWRAFLANHDFPADQ